MALLSLGLLGLPGHALTAQAAWPLLGRPDPLWVPRGEGGQQGLGRPVCRAAEALGPGQAVTPTRQGGQEAAPTGRAWAWSPSRDHTATCVHAPTPPCWDFRCRPAAQAWGWAGRGHTAHSDAPCAPGPAAPPPRRLRAHTASVPRLRSARRWVTRSAGGQLDQGVQAAAPRPPMNVRGPGARRQMAGPARYWIWCWM